MDIEISKPVIRARIQISIELMIIFTGRQKKSVCLFFREKIMFYRLNPEYVLRGWEEMSWVLVRRPDNDVRLLTREMFQVLLLCDGETDLPGDLLDRNMCEELYRCEADGIISASASPCSLEEDQYYKYYHNRYTKSVFWSITGRCNFHCRHCYMDAPEAALGELSTEEALDLIDQMAECGVLQVDLTGGEPFVRKDFWELVDRILSHKIVISQIYTNGWLLNEKTLDEFEKRGLKPEINISFDGVGWHDWMRGTEGAEEASLHAMELCHKRGFPVSVAMCIHRGSRDVLPRTVKVLQAVGVTDIRVANVDKTDLWSRNSEGNALTRREYIETVLPYVEWYYREGRPIKRLVLGGVAQLYQDRPGEISVRHYDGTEKCKECYLCGAVRWSCYITPEGRLLPCMPMTASPGQERFPKVQDIGLRQGLKDSYYMQFVDGRVKDLFAANKECDACEYRYECGGGCRAAALLTGEHDLMGCDRDMCMMWKEGYVERIRRTLDEVNAKYGMSEEKGGIY